MRMKTKWMRMRTKLAERKRTFVKTLKRTWPLYVLLLPALVYILMFKYSSMYGAIIAFKDYKIRDGIWGSAWVGFKWFKKFFEYYECWTLIENTLRISIYNIVISLAISIVLALMINCIRSKRLKNIVQTVTYMPHFVSVVVLVGIVIRFFNPSMGAISKLIQALGGTDRDLMGVAEALPHIYVWSDVWQNAGWNTVLYLAALTAVDTQLHEAGIVDGATRLQRVWYIDVPAITPTIVISLIMKMGSVLSVGTEKILLLQNDLNRSTTEVIATYVYSKGIASSSPQYSYATAIGLLNSVITVHPCSRKGDRKKMSVKLNAITQNKVRKRNSDRIFYVVNGSILVLFTIVCIYPILCIISQAISNPVQVGLGLVTFFPRGFSLRGFYEVLKDEWLIHGFLMSVLYTVVGTVINVVITYITAFALSRKELPGRGFLQLLFAFTMWFSGGLIPQYLVMKSYGLINTFWSLILPGAMSVWNMIVCRTFLQNSIPEELFEAAKMDGAGYFRYMVEITLPLAKAIIAVLVLWYAIGHWNAYFDALVYISDKTLKPFSLYLREYLVMNSTMDIADLTAGEEVGMELMGLTELMKNSLILLSCLPLWILYPFVKKYLVQGVMIGSVKG